MIHRPRKRLLLLLSLLLALGAFLAAIPALGSSSESTRAVLFGYSPQRMAFAGALLLLGLLFGWAGFNIVKDTPRASRWIAALLGSEAARRRLFWIALGLCLLGWVGWALPAYRLPEGLSDYVLRLRPLMLWLAGLGAGGLVVLLAERRALGAVPALPAPSLLYAAGLALSVLLLIWLVMSLTGLGIRIREDYWYGAGVPVLPVQVLFSLAVGLLAGRMDLSERLRGWKRWDFLVCTVIWAASAVLWAREPLRATFFMPGPSYPNRDFYPFSDAALFDTGSQFALIGQGLFNGTYFDRALYSAFLTYLHALVGQNFIRVLAVQAAVFAVFPVIAYLIGRELQGRALGGAAATLIALRGVNSIAAAGWIDLASPKMTLTDFPTAIMLALFTLLAIRWLKNPGAGWRSAMWAGCSLGLAIMLRTHTLLLLPLIILFALVVYRFSWRAWLTGVSLLVLGMVLVTMPWDLRTHARGAPLFSVYFYRIYVVLRDRYQWWPLVVPPAPATPGSSLVPLAPLHAASLVPLAQERCGGLLCAGINHFLHDLETSVLFLPTSLGLDDLRHVVKETFPYWQQGWLGEGFSPLWAAFLAVNLALIALGIGRAWTERRWVGLAPLVVYLAYGLSNAFALTSGGRYIVPMDWIVCIYFLLGALTVAGWVWDLLYGERAASIGIRAKPGSPAVRSFRQSLPGGLITGALILSIGLLVPLAELPFPPRYANLRNPDQAMAELKSRGLAGTAGLDTAQISRFLASPNAQILAGRELYPRYYEAGQGETPSDYPYAFKDFPRLAFTLIDPQGQVGVILPGKMPLEIPNASDVIVLGCTGAQYLDALAVFVLDDPARVYTRWPEAPLECPVPQPVCVDKDTCY